MKTNILSFLLLIGCYQYMNAQKASDVLENGITVRNGEKIFFHFESNELKYDVARSLGDAANPPDFTSLEDSTIFMVANNGVNVYLKPLNPLNYSYSRSLLIISDPINDEALEAFTTIADVVSNISRKTALSASEKTCHTEIERALMTIQSTLQDSQKTKIAEAFKKLKALTFEDESSTVQALESIGVTKKEIEAHFDRLNKSLTEAEKKIEDENCQTEIGFTFSYIFKNILKDFKVRAAEQKKRLTNLQAAFTLADEMQQKAVKGGGAPGLNWCIKLDEIPSKEGKISIYILTIKNSGVHLSDDGEIVTGPENVVLTRTIRIRHFQRFVPEVSIGTAYTFFKYNTYGTTSNEDGDQFIAEPAENIARNLNITTMVNFNYFIPNSSIHPLYQVGLGINSGIPTLITGIGIRSNINGMSRLAISFGLAATWIQVLDKLKVGDKISGTDDIQQDLKFEFNWPPKPYVGLQFNF